jgi:hypothetical protein
MARAPSGRIVIDAGEELKNRLYTALAYQGIRVKEWFCRADEATIEETNLTAPNGQSLIFNGILRSVETENEPRD